MKFSQTERGTNNFSAASRGDQKFNRVFHPVSITPPPPPPPGELNNDNSLNSTALIPHSHQKLSCLKSGVTT